MEELEGYLGFKFMTRKIITTTALISLIGYNPFSLSLAAVASIGLIGIPFLIAFSLAPAVLVFSLVYVLFNEHFQTKNPINKTSSVFHWKPFLMTILVLGFIPLLFNLSLYQSSKAYLHDDRIQKIEKSNFKTIALISKKYVSRFNNKTDEEWCNGLCARILLSGLADRVIVTPAENLLDINEIAQEKGTAYTFQPHDPCFELAVKGEDVMGEHYNDTRGANLSLTALLELKSSTNSCIRMESAKVEEADAIFVNGFIKSARHRNKLSSFSGIFSDPTSVDRLSLFIKNDQGSFDEEYRATSAKSSYLFPLLVPGVVSSVGSGLVAASPWCMAMGTHTWFS